MRMFITKPQFQLNNSIPVTTSKWTTVDEESATPAPDEDFVKSTSVLPAPDEATTPELNRELNFYKYNEKSTQYVEVRVSFQREKSRLMILLS